MTSPCIDDNHSCMDKPSVGNGVRGLNAASWLPRIFGEAKSNHAGRPHVKSAGVRTWLTSEGYRHVTWYRLLSLLFLSILGMAGFSYSSTHSSIFTVQTPGGSSIIQKIMYRIRLGWLPTLAVSTCVVLGNETVVNKTFDVFDYVDPLIGTINGG